MILNMDNTFVNSHRNKTLTELKKVLFKKKICECVVRVIYISSKNLIAKNSNLISYK